MDTFETDYLPILRRMAKHFFRYDADKEADALSYGWWRWRKLRGKPVKPARLAWLVCAEVRRGKGNIPAPGRRPQPYEAFTRSQVGMWPDLYADRAPGVLRTVIARDIVRMLHSRLSGRRVALLDRFACGETHLGCAADALGVTVKTIHEDMAQVRRIARHLLRA